MLGRENLLHQQQRLRFSISNARLLYKNGDFAEAILNYIAVLKSYPTQNREAYLHEYLNVLRAYLQQETDDSCMRDILHISTSLYGSEFQLWRILAEHNFQNGKLLKSLENFDEATRCAKTDIEWLHASSSRENVKSHMFDAWHWRMVNDGKRNAKFAAAIELALKKKPDAKVLDIGCGSGILSVIAARNNNETFACDHNEVMCDIAKNCYADNMIDCHLFDELENLFECISNKPGFVLYETHSKKLQLNTRCNLLVTETVDSAIFGEQIVDTILDAKERLLEPDATVIPNKAVALFSLIESDSICQENFYEHGDSVALISTCCNLAELGNHKRVIPPSPYTCAYLNELHNGYKLLSNPVEGLAVDFNNIQQLRQIKNDRFLTEIILSASNGGMASAVCVWFRMNLFEHHEICSAPEEGYCWQQAIFPFYPPRHVLPEEQLRFEVFIKNGALHVQPSWLCQQLCREILRVPAWMDLNAMNDPAIRTFFKNSTANIPSIPGASWYSQILDCTELLLNEKYSIASGQSTIRYINSKAINMDKAVCKTGGAILFWPFSNQGSLMSEYVASIIDLRNRSPETTLIPCQIVLKGCLINSSELCKRSQLIRDKEESRKTYCGVEMAAMGEYGVTHFHEIETRTLPFKQISEDIEMFRMRFGKKIYNDCGNQLTIMKHECILTCNERSACHALLYWFEMVDPAGKTLDLRRQTRSFLSSAYILPVEKQLEEGDMLKTQFSMLHGNLLFHWVKEVLFL